MTTVINGTRTKTANGNTYKRLTKPGPYKLVDFEANNLGGLISVEYEGVFKGLHLEKGVCSNIDRVLTMPDADAQLDGFVVRKITAKGLERGFLRLKKARNGVVEDIVAVGAAASTTDEFRSAFATAKEHAQDNIVYRRCSAKGFRMDVDDGEYPNGDGFADERDSTRFVYEDCKATDCADGLDSKAPGVVIRRFRAIGCRRNLRLWGSGLVEDFYSEGATNAHIWIGGGDGLKTYDIVRPVFKGGSDRPHVRIESGNEKSLIRIINPVVPAGEKLRVSQIESGKLVKVEVIRR